MVGRRDQSLDLLNVAAPDSVFIDDVPANLPPAETMGMTVIHHIDTRHTLTRLDQIFNLGVKLTQIGLDGRLPGIQPER